MVVEVLSVDSIVYKFNLSSAVEPERRPESAQGLQPGIDGGDNGVEDGSADEAITDRTG